MRRLGGGPGLLLLAMLAACGGQSTNIGQTASARLSPEVQQVRTAAASGDKAAAAAKLAELRQTVADLRQHNELSEAGAAKVLAAAAEVEAQLGVAVGSPTAQVSTTALPAPTDTRTPSPPVNQNGGNGDKGKGKGKG